MKACQALIAWTPPGFGLATDGQVGVRLLTDDDSETEWLGHFAYAGGAAFFGVQDLRGDAARLRVFVEFHTLVVRDGLDPQHVHDAFLAIDEYAEAIAPDTPGARSEKK